MIVFATSKGKTADQNWIASEWKTESNDFIKHIKQFFSIDARYQRTYSYATKATGHNSDPHVS
jgi:hypothetical protein